MKLTKKKKKNTAYIKKKISTGLLNNKTNLNHHLLTVVVLKVKGHQS